METPKNPAGRLTERLMAAITPHIRRDPPPQDNHHYNRAYEEIFAILCELWDTARDRKIDGTGVATHHRQ